MTRFEPGEYDIGLFTERHKTRIGWKVLHRHLTLKIWEDQTTQKPMFELVGTLESCCKENRCSGALQFLWYPDNQEIKVINDWSKLTPALLKRVLKVKADVEMIFR